MKMRRLKELFNEPIVNFLFLCTLFIVAMCAVLSNKVNYHVDEIFTYGKANYRTPASFYEDKSTGCVFIPIEDGKIYIPGRKVLMDYVTVQPEYRFNYANVWRNEAKAVHPPVHTALVHTVSSFFPGRFSLWFAASVNMVFAVLTLVVVRSLSRCYVQDERVVNIISITFAFSGGILSAVTFLRMYIMAMFWVTLLTYCFVREVKEGSGKSSFFLKVFAVTVCGAMTHYYSIVYAILISTTYGIWLLFKHRYREVFRFLGAMTAAGIISYLLFPAMVQHIFFGPRGLEVIGNAANFSDFFNRLKVFCQIINKQLFGSLGYILVLGVIIVSSSLIDKYCCTFNKDGQIDASNLTHRIRINLPMHYVLLCFPTVIYFIIVSKITVYQTDRYMFPIYANIILLACLVLDGMFCLLSVSKNCKIAILCFMLCAMTVKSWFTVGWHYLYLDSKPFLDKVATLPDVDSVCLYKEAWCTCALFMESQTYQSIQFCSFDNKNAKQDIFRRIKMSNPEKLVVTLVQPPDKHEIYLQKILEQSGTLNHYRKLGSHFYGHTTSYLLF